MRFAPPQRGLGRVEVGVTAGQAAAKEQRGVSGRLLVTTACRSFWAVPGEAFSAAAAGLAQDLFLVLSQHTPR